MHRLGLPLVVGVVQLGAARLALGRPDAGHAVAFLTGGRPTTTEALAAAQLLVWLMVLTAVAWTGLAIGRELRRHPPARRRIWEGSMLLTGIAILLAGALHHFTYQVGMSGGSIQEAQGILGH